MEKNIEWVELCYFCGKKKNMIMLRVFLFAVILCTIKSAFAVERLVSENQLKESGCYEVLQDVTLTQNIKIAKGVTLLFSGGTFKATSPIVLTGQYTVLQAPDSEIFSSNITVKGQWQISYASPLWFSTKTTAGEVDYAECINKAAVMIGKGTVRLPRGIFRVGQPIMLPAGVTLQGASGNSSWDISEWNTSMPESLYYGTTRITPIKGSGNWIRGVGDDSGAKYLVYVNANKSQKIIFPYPTQWVSLKNLKLYNDSSLPFLGGVYSAGGSGFEEVVWENFNQALCYSNDYADNKMIKNCQYDCSIKSPWPESPQYDRRRYAVDFGFLGDGLQVEHCHFSTAGHAMLYVSGCGGGEIKDNIINGEVKIVGSKAVTFSSNHLEYGTQLKVNASVVDINNNYFEKDSLPSIEIGSLSKQSDENTVVVLRNNQYAFIDRNRSMWGDEKMEDKENRLERICEYDILIDNRAYVDISNEYRYELVVGFGRVVPSGIKITTPEGEFREFNEKSYVFSQKCHIGPNYGLQATARLNNMNKAGVDFLQVCEWVNWFRPTGAYTYSFQYAPDLKRGIYECRDGKVIRKVNNGQVVILEKYDLGTLLVLGENGAPIRSNLRLFRTRQKSVSDASPLSVEYVDVPVTGSRYIYDNGISVCGNKWREIDSILYPSKITVYKSLQIDGSSVSSWCESLPDLTSGWEQGDLLYNVGKELDWNIVVVK